MNKIFFLCDGEVNDCDKTYCYKDGGPCKHTEHPEYGVNVLLPPEKRHFVKDEKGNDWEV